MAEYRFSAESLADMVDLFSYTDSVNPSYSARLEHEFTAAFEHLSQWPFSGHAREYLTSSRVKFWRVERYLITYRTQEWGIEIVAIFHGSQDVPRLLATRGFHE